MTSPAVQDSLPAPPPTESPAGAPDLYCPECGYDLRGLEGAERCPECGLAIDRSGAARSQIPWVHRRHIGRARAYWRTLKLATLHPRRIAAEATAPVDYLAAQRFRWTTAFVAAAPIVAGIVGAMAWYGSAAFFSLIAPAALPGWAVSGPPTPALDILIPWDSGATLPPVLPLAVLVALVFVTGVASYWFHPKHLPVVRQNRAVALSYYACAPLAAASVPVLCYTAAAVMHQAGIEGSANAVTVLNLLNVFGFLSGLAVVGLAWRAAMTLLRRTTDPGAGRFVLAGAIVPITWLLCAVLPLFAVPWVVGFVRLVINSLR